MLYVVPTPIGNLEDITLRSIRVLKEVDVVACEDTRTSRVLLSHYDITTPYISYHNFNERRRAEEFVNRMKAGESIALISDAGTPGISDPAFFLVRECIRHDLPIEVLPGATAFVPALVSSGLPSDRFTFEGFLPVKKGRASRLKSLENEERTMIFYESPHRIVRTLEQFRNSFGPERQGAVAREISKRFEEIRRGTLDELWSYFSAAAKPRGEFVVVISGAQGKVSAPPTF